MGTKNNFAFTLIVQVLRGKKNRCGFLKHMLFQSSGEGEEAQKEFLAMELRFGCVNAFPPPWSFLLLSPFKVILIL